MWIGLQCVINCIVCGKIGYHFANILVSVWEQLKWRFFILFDVHKQVFKVAQKQCAFNCTFCNLKIDDKSEKIPAKTIKNDFIRFSNLWTKFYIVQNSSEMYKKLIKNRKSK